MTLDPHARLMEPEQIALRAGAPATQPLRLPEPGLFAERALRLRQLAPGHPLRDYLLFVAALAQAQHEQLKTLPALELPTAAALEAAAGEGRAPLDARQLPRATVWRELLRRLLRGLAPQALPEAARQVRQRLLDSDDATLERQAQALLDGRGLGLEADAAPFVSAALQLYWTGLVQQVQARHGQDRIAPFGLVDDPVRCPCCAALPVASITRLAAEGSGLRYLACSLCGTQWPYVRIKCARCQGTKGISFQSLVRQDAEQAQGGAQAVQAECCEPCGHYLKIVHREKDLQVEPLADDLASLGLDMLLGEAGLARHGDNPLLVFGEGEPMPEQPSGGAPPGPPPDPAPDPRGR